nr:response regulator [Cytophagales bacterium]
MLNLKRIKNQFFITFILFIGKAIVVFPQTDLSFRQLSVNDGLSQNSAISVTQDQVGFLWIATQEGLNRYDGKEFKVYDKKFSDITQTSRLLLGKVFADSKNRIWIIPDTSIPEVLDSTGDQFLPTEGVNGATCIQEDKQGNIWVGSSSGELAKWNESISRFELIWEDQTREINDIDIFGSDSILITFTDDLGVWYKKSNSVTLLERPKEGLSFSCSAIDGENNIWVGTLNAGIFYVPNRSQIISRVHELADFEWLHNSDFMVLDIKEDSKGNMWVATYGGGLIRFNVKEKSTFNYSYSKQNPRSIHYNDILCIFEDYTGTLWFGTDGAGLSFYDRFLEKFNFFHNQQVREDINIDVVRALFVDQYETIWIGTSGKGLTSYSPHTGVWKTYTHEDRNPNGIKSNRVMSLLGDGKGKLWIGYQEEGLSILDLKTLEFEHFNFQSGVQLPANTIWKIHKDKGENFWLGTRNNGLIQFDPQKGVLRQFLNDPVDPNSIPENNIRTIEEGKQGYLWIGTETQGIGRFDDASGKFQSFSHHEGNPESISSNSIKSLYFDGKSMLWIGTNGTGINALNTDSGEIIRITTKDGLANDVVYGILPDASGNLWLSSNKGITKIAILPNQSPAYKITNYSNYDGLGTEFNTGAYFKHQDGAMYFGSLEGFYWFNSSEILLNETAPKTALTGLYVFDEPKAIHGAITLGHDENTLTINMASLVFSSPYKNEFQYKLENHDDNWIFSANNHQARYTNLSPGTYTFMAKSSNYDGVWSDEPVSFQFTILPPWYLSRWAKWAYLIMVTLAVMGVYYYLNWRWQMKLLFRLKAEEAERLQDIDKFKTNLFTNISHEFRTPLTLIAGPVERLMSQSENPVFRSNLSLIKQNSQRLLNLVDQLLEVSKIKSGTLQLKIQKGNLSLLLQSIVANFFYFAAEKDIGIRSDIPLMTEVWFDDDKVEKIVSNLLQNAIKYGKPGTTVQLTAQIKNSQLHLAISNQSLVKYTKGEISSLFDKFYKTDSKSEGFGIGLPLVKDLVEITQGKISLHVDEANFFWVEIQIPIDKFFFRPEQVLEEEAYDQHTRQIDPDRLSGDHSPLVLVVEDNAMVRSFLVDELRLHYKILEADNGRDGLLIAFKQIPDLIISDVMMPDVDGIELCKTLKSDEKTSHIPIILLTAKSEEDNILKGLEVGADDYMLKPFRIKQLLVRIEKLIELRRNLRIRYARKAVISPKEIAITSTDEVFLNKIQRIVDEDLADSNFSVDEFCKKLGMSRMQLHRKLTALTGLSTSAFIRDQRLRMAIQRLEKSGETISEIAYAVGFSSPSYFIKCFKDSYGVTPNDFLEKKK